MIVDCDGKTTREVNRLIRQAAQEHGEVLVANPRARHNLGVGLDVPASVRFQGSVGYYCGGLNAAARIEIVGNAGWGCGEAMAGGEIRVRGDVGLGCGASMRGGTIVVEGDGGPRTGIAMKGGTIVVCGSVGFLSGFMAHAGKLVVLGDAAEGLGDSLYEGRLFVAGRIRGLGNDAVIEDPTEEEREEIAEDLRRAGIAGEFDFKKVVAGRKLWYFDKREAESWLKI